MRKSFFLSILAVGALVAGCAKSEVVDSKYGNDMIGFETYLGRDAQTKVTPTLTETFNEFGVYGFYTGNAEYAKETVANLMNPVKVSNGAEGWTYSPVKYWTNATDNYTFLAYAPWSLTTTQRLDANGDAALEAPEITYTVDDDIAKQIDVLYSNNNKNVSKEECTTTPVAGGETVTTVPFTFKHALSRITVKANAEMYDKSGEKVEGTETPDGGYDNTFTITSIQLAGPFNTTGIFNLNEGKWTTLTAGTGTYSFFAGQQALTATVYDFSETIVAEDNTVTWGDNYLMALPTDFSAKTGEGEAATFTKTAILTVKYTVTYAGSTSAENTATVAINTNFEQGKAYSINIKLMRDPDNAITFDVVEVEGWGTETVVDKNVEA